MDIGSHALHFSDFTSCAMPIQNQFFISGLSGDDTIKNRVLEALYKRILRAHNEKKSFRVIVVIPLLPRFQVTFPLECCLHFSKVISSDMHLF